MPTPKPSTYPRPYPYVMGFNDKSESEHLEFRGTLTEFRAYMAGVEAAHVDRNQCMGCGESPAVWKHTVSGSNYCKNCIGAVLTLRAEEMGDILKLIVA